MQKEIDRLQSELAASNQALGAANEEKDRLKTPQQDSASGGLPSREVLEETYTASAKTLRKEIVEKLNGFSIDSCTLHPVQIDETVAPVTSQISLSLHSQQGASYSMTFPVRANASGKWKFPSADEVAARFQAVASATPTPAPTAQSQAQQRPAATAAGQPGLVEPMKAGGGTIMIEWPESRSGAARTAPSQPAAVPASQPAPTQAELPASQPAASPSQPEGAKPAPVMPVSRDVIIKF